MKIQKISITNYRSIKDTQLIENIEDSLILTWINNSWKSSILNALNVFFWEKDLTKEDFYKWTDEIKIIIDFINIDDEYLRNFCQFKKTWPQTTILKRNEPFISFTKDTISSKDDLETPEQIKFIEDERLDNFKINNNIIDWYVSIECIINKIDIKKNYNHPKIIQIFPNIIFVDDERNFENEEFWWTWSITKKFFEWLDLKSDTDLSIDVIKNKKWEDLDIAELEKLLKYKTDTISSFIWDKISSNFSKYYNDDFSVKINTDTTIAHKNFSLETMIVDPILWEIWLSSVWAWLRALYLLSLLKAYNDNFKKNNYTIFLIEEPELYLHPWLQKEMASILLNISREQQVFFTTHSPLLLKNFDLWAIKEVKKEDYKSIINTANFNDIINNLWYSIFDIINYQYIIFVEWRDDYKVLKSIISKFYPDKLDKVSIVTSNWCWNLAFYASLKFLGLTNSGDLKYIILRDRDDKDDITLISEFKSDLLDKDFNSDFIDELVSNFKILNRYSIENFFLKEEIIISIESSYSEENFKTDLINFIQSRDTSLQTKQPDIFNNIVDLVTNDFENLKIRIRGHNIFNALLFHIRKKGIIFFDEYINNSNLEVFEELKEYLDELFNI